MQVFQFADGPDACRACRYFGELDGLTWGACRRRAPVVAPDTAASHRGWPAVHDDDECGEFERKMIVVDGPALETIPTAPVIPPIPGLPVRPPMPFPAPEAGGQE